MVTWREEDSGLKRKQRQVICQMLSASFDPEAQSSQHRIAGGNPRYLVGGDDVLDWSGTNVERKCSYRFVVACDGGGHMCG